MSDKRSLWGSVGDAYDNAMAESFFATLSERLSFALNAHLCELLDRRRFKTHAEARIALFAFIEGFYNPRRRHSSLGYRSPAAFETRAFDPGAHQPAIVLASIKDGLETPGQAVASVCRPSLTAASHDSQQNVQAGMKR